MEEDIFEGSLWTDQVKMIGSGDCQERVEFESFNSAEVDQYRGVLDDIAKELGGRVQKTDLTTLGEKLSAAIVNVYIPDNARDHRD